MSKGEGCNSIDTNRSDDSIMESHSQLWRFQFALMVSLWMLYTNRAVPSLKLAACLLVKSVPWSGKELKSTVSLPGDALLIHLTALNQNYPSQCKKWASPSAEVHPAPVWPPERARSMPVQDTHDLHKAGRGNSSREATYDTRNPIIRIDWDCETSGYAENSDNWKFLVEKWATFAVWRGENDL